MTLFILTKNEFYYEHFLLNDSEISDKSFEIKVINFYHNLVSFICFSIF